MRDTYDETRCAALFARFAKNGTWQVPTLIIHESRQLATEAGISTNPALRYVPADVAAVRHARGSGQDAGRPSPMSGRHQPTQWYESPCTGILGT
jgi:hypothetical protein